MRRMMRTITPAFDPSPDAKCWFVDEFPGIEAPTLRELLKKLPKGIRLTNYYPMGKSVPRPSWGSNAGDMVSAEGHIIVRKKVIVRNRSKF